jgi:hypothetical protein
MTDRDFHMATAAITDKAGAPRGLVVGGGPAGLAAANQMARAGLAVTVIDQAPTLGRKFLMAGRGGLNLTHSEPLASFLTRYGDAEARLTPILEAFPPAALIAFAQELGQAPFVGSSGRVFPKPMKASPMLRVWLTRLREAGVELRPRTRFLDFAEGGARVEGPQGEGVLTADAVVLAMGGASWPRLGSDARWTGALEAAGARLAPFAPSNCGVRIDWSAKMAARHGEPLKRVALFVGAREARGDVVVTRTGLEGGPIYALSPLLRDALAAGEPARLSIDLRPDLDAAALAARLDGRRKGDSLSNALRKSAGLSAAAATLLFEAGRPPVDSAALAAAIKDVRLPVAAVAGLDRAISSAGGVRFEMLDETLMMRMRPGVFLAGEMLDWEAPTGGYLLQACFSTGVAAGRAAAAYARRG